MNCYSRFSPIFKKYSKNKNPFAESCNLGFLPTAKHKSWILLVAIWFLFSKAISFDLTKYAKSFFHPQYPFPVHLGDEPFSVTRIKTNQITFTATQFIFLFFCFPHSVCLTTPTRLIVMKFIYARDPFRPSLAILPQTGICHKGYSRWNREEKHTIEKHGMCFAVYLCFCWCRTRHLNWKQSYYFGSVCCPYIPVTAFGRWMKQAPPNYILEGISTYATL